MQEWNLVEHICKPLTLFLPVDIQSPNGVVERSEPILTLVVNVVQRGA